MDIEPMDWEDVMLNVENPVYDEFDKKWKILNGYMKKERNFYINFYGDESWYDFKIRKIYLKEI